LINDILRRDEKTLSDFGLRQPAERNVNRYIQQETYNMCDMQDYVNENFDRATEEQQDIYKTVVDATRIVKNQNGTSDHHNIFFLDAYAGTGKTWTINMILAGVRAEGGIALATASSGIAALLLSGGSTSYSTFKIPLNVTENSTCNVSKHKDIADMLRKSSLIVWDEVTLSHKHAIETVDRLLRDIMSTPHQRCEIPFGGKVVLFSGDFRQILPVIPLGNEPTIVGSSLKGSIIWSYV